MEWNPSPKYELYLHWIDEILTDEKRTVRDIYYALESRGFPAECEEQGYGFEYRYVKRAVKKGRRAGYIDPSLIVDTSRQAVTTPSEGYENPREFAGRIMSTVKTGYDENRWRDQEHYVEVWLEKQSLASVFQPICSEWNVRLEATRGDWSDSKVYEAAERLTEKLDAGKKVRVVYWGDFNPSGFHAPVSVQQTLAHYGLDLGPRQQDEPENRYFDIWPMDGPSGWKGHDDADIMFERAGLNLEHIKRYDLPENPNPSSTDKDRELKERFQRHVSAGRDVNVELNALKEFHRGDLEDEIEAGITQYVHDPLWKQAGARIEERQEAIADAFYVEESKIEDA